MFQARIDLNSAFISETPNTLGEKENWESSGYKIFVNADHSSGERIDLPGDLIHTTNYCATLGHKMNHNFEYNCSEWFFDHPRHGTIPCAVAITDIPSGRYLLTISAIK